MLYLNIGINLGFLKKEKKQYQVYIEREVLTKLNHPGVIKIFFSFQDKNRLYFVLEFCQGGEFSDFLKIYSIHSLVGNYLYLKNIILLENIDIDIIKYYSAELISIVEYLHQNGIAHRDLKVLETNRFLIQIFYSYVYFSFTSPKIL